VRALALAALVPVQIAAGSLLLYQHSFADRIYPRIAIMDVAVGGQTPAQATAAIKAYLDEIAQQPLILQADDAQVATTLGDLGLTPPADAARLVERAWHLGRASRAADWLPAQWALLRRGERLPLNLGLDRERGRATLAQLAQGLNRPAVDASLAVELVEGGYALQATPAQAGVTVNVEATLDRLQEALWQGVPSRLDVVFERIAPSVADEQVAPAQRLATQILDGPLTFRRDEAHQWDVPAAALATALRIVPAGDVPAAGVKVQIDEDKLAELIAGIASQADVPAQNPRLEVQGDRLAIQPGKPGRLVDRQATLRQAVARLAAGERSVLLPMAEVTPSLAEADFALARDWANARLALPLMLEYEGRRWALDRRDLAACLVFTDPQPSSPSDPARHSSPTPDVRLDTTKLRDVLARTVPPRIGLDPAQVASDAGLEVRDHRVEIRPARAGLGVDFDALAADLAGRFAATDLAQRTATVPVAPHTPRLSEAQMAPAREQAQRLIGRPVVVRDAFEEWQVTPEQLETMLRFQESNGQVVAYLGRDQLLERVEAIARQAESRTGPNAVLDAAGRPAKVDRLLTAAAIWTAAQADKPEDRIADLQWADGV
jgi:vancomycin resistance protein YoaR